MRLLNVETLAFQIFFSDIPPYAIASHRWATGLDAEAMLSDIQNKTETPAYGYSKVLGFIEYVRKHIPDVQWLWIDTCCIDQRSSAEVSEAINSMFAWFRDAKVCLAYLQDVPSADAMFSFETSEWFSRGWTLQELLAPPLVLFLASDWEVIGCKAHSDRVGANDRMKTGPTLHKLVATITHIPQDILEDYSESDDVSAEDKMRWMANRQTTRGEDLTYCMLGILEVNMTIRYGDGKDATRERLLRKMKRHALAIPKARLRPSSNAAPQRDPHLVERADLMDDVRRKLNSSGRSAALVGRIGTGKSHLASEYARQLRMQAPSTSIFWINGRTGITFDKSVRDIIVPPPLDQTQSSVDETQHTNVSTLQVFLKWLRKPRDESWLIVLDNVDDAGFLFEPLITVKNGDTQISRSDCLSTGNHGRSLIVGRSKIEALRIVTEDDIIFVPAMTEDEATALAENRLGTRRDDNRLLAQFFEYLPLSIVQATQIMRQSDPPLSTPKYLRGIEKTRSSDLICQQDKVEHSDRKLGTDDSIIGDWQASIQHLERTQPTAAELLMSLAFCGPEPIPEELMRMGKNHRASTNDRMILRSFSFLLPSPQNGSWTINPIGQVATQLLLETYGMSSFVRDRFINVLDQAFSLETPADPRLCTALIPHVNSVVDRRPEDPAALAIWARLLIRAANHANFINRKPIAARMAAPSLAATSQLLGEDHPIALARMTATAVVYCNNKRPDEAEVLHLKVLQHSIKTHGLKHARTVQAMQQLKQTIWSESRLAMIENLHLTEMCARMDRFGAEHVDTLSSKSRVAMMWNLQMLCGKAERLGREVLDSRRRILGPTHPDTAQSMGVLANVNVSLEQTSIASTLYSEASKIYHDMLVANGVPAKRPSWWQAGRTDHTHDELLDEADRLVLKDLRSVKGTARPASAMLQVKHRLMKMRQHQGRWDEAEELIEEMLATCHANFPNSSASARYVGILVTSRIERKRVESQSVQYR